MSAFAIILILLVILFIVIYYLIIKPKQNLRKSIKEKFELGKQFLRHKDKLERDLNDCKNELARSKRPFNQTINDLIHQIDAAINDIYVDFEPNKADTKSPFQLAIQITKIREALKKLTNLDKKEFDELRDKIIALRD